MSLYLPQDLHPARMALSATTCLSMVTFFKGSQHGPKTSYIKAIGIWAALCCSIVFFCLIEYCFVLVLSQDLMHQHRKVPKILEKLSKIFISILILMFVMTYFVICFLH